MVSRNVVVVCTMCIQMDVVSRDMFRDMVCPACGAVALSEFVWQEGDYLLRIGDERPATGMVLC